MTTFVAPKLWLSPFGMRYFSLPGWMMTLSKRQDGYLNQQVNLFRLQYETHSLQMHLKLPCMSVVAPTPNLLDQQYSLRLVAVPCQCSPSPLPLFQLISPSPSSNIYSVAVPHILCRRIHLYCPTYLPPCSSAAVFTADLVCYPRYPESPPCFHCHPPTSLLRFSLNYLSSSRVLSRYFSLPSRIIYSPRSASSCTTLLAPLCSALLFSLFALILSLRFPFLFWHGSSLSPWCSCFAPICRVFLHLPSLRSAPISSFPSALYAPICLPHLWYAQLRLIHSCSDLLAPIWLDQIDQICSFFRSSGTYNFS